MGNFKNLPANDSVAVWFHGEFFNTFSHTTIPTANAGTPAKSPVQTVSSAGLGNLLAANDSRTLQRTIKVVF